MYESSVLLIGRTLQNGRREHIDGFAVGGFLPFRFKYPPFHGFIFENVSHSRAVSVLAEIRHVGGRKFEILYAVKSKCRLVSGRLILVAVFYGFQKIVIGDLRLGITAVIDVLVSVSGIENGGGSELCVKSNVSRSARFDLFYLRPFLKIFGGVPALELEINGIPRRTGVTFDGSGKLHIVIAAVGEENIVEIESVVGYVEIHGIASGTLRSHGDAVIGTLLAACADHVHDGETLGFCRNVHHRPLGFADGTVLVYDFGQGKTRPFADFDYLRKLDFILAVLVVIGKGLRSGCDEIGVVIYYESFLIIQINGMTRYRSDKGNYQNEHDRNDDYGRRFLRNLYVKSVFSHTDSEIITVYIYYIFLTTIMSSEENYRQ